MTDRPYPLTRRQTVSGMVVTTLGFLFFLNLGAGGFVLAMFEGDSFSEFETYLRGMARNLLLMNAALLLSALVQSVYLEGATSRRGIGMGRYLRRGAFLPAVCSGAILIPTCFQAASMWAVALAIFAICTLGGVFSGWLLWFHLLRLDRLEQPRPVHPPQPKTKPSTP